MASANLDNAGPMTGHLFSTAVASFSMDFVTPDSEPGAYLWLWAY